jgi:hypothetical protein
VSVSSPDLRERIGQKGLVALIGLGYRINPNVVPGLRLCSLEAFEVSTAISKPTCKPCL